MARIAQIVSTARYLFEHAVTNAKLTEHFTVLGRPTVIDRLANSTGIMQRFYASDGWATSDLAVPAAKEALKRAGCKPEDGDLIIVGTTSPDYTTPDTSLYSNTNWERRTREFSTWTAPARRSRL